MEGCEIRSGVDGADEGVGDLVTHSEEAALAEAVAADFGTTWNNEGLLID